MIDPCQLNYILQREKAISGPRPVASIQWDGNHETYIRICEKMPKAMNLLSYEYRYSMGVNYGTFSLYGAWMPEKPIELGSWFVRTNENFAVFTDYEYKQLFAIDDTTRI